MIRQKMRNYFCSAVLVLLAGRSGADGAAPSGPLPPCLFALHVGVDKIPISPCEPGDTIGIGVRAEVLATMLELGIPRDRVKFLSCPGQPLLTGPFSASDHDHYVIRYPPEASGPDLDAAIAHELAHVLQMRAIGGLDALRLKYSSLQVELSADFVAGVVFANAMKGRDVNEFQHSLLVHGLYQEASDLAHGSPAQRTNAFRYGERQSPPYNELDASHAMWYFLANDYKNLVHD